MIQVIPNLQRRLFVLLVVSLTFYSMPVAAFPPYKTTDADTADPYALELRFGLVQMEWAGGETKTVSPLIRANFGLPNKFELISEFEYNPDENEFSDGALGFKWIPPFDNRRLSFGIETLALLPVRPSDSGVGIESQFLATWKGSNLQVHVNAGGFHDPRTSESENGWRASMLTERTNASFRPGIELFAKQKDGEDVDVRLGFGFIKNVGGFEIRSGLHFGLTHEAPDIVFNLWISTKLPFRKHN